MKLIIGLDDGIILDAKRCVLVDDGVLGEADRALLDSGTEAQSLGVAYRLGKSLHEILEGVGYGDLNYGNCIAYSALAIREEIEEKISAIAEVDTERELMPYLEWALSLSDEQLSIVGQMVVATDEAWQDYFTNIIMALQWAKEHNIITETEERNG